MGAGARTEQDADDRHCPGSRAGAEDVTPEREQGHRRSYRVLRDKGPLGADSEVWAEIDRLHKEIHRLEYSDANNSEYRGYYRDALLKRGRQFGELMTEAQRLREENRLMREALDAARVFADPYNWHTNYDGHGIIFQVEGKHGDASCDPFIDALRQALDRLEQP